MGGLYNSKRTSTYYLIEVRIDAAAHTLKPTDKKYPANTVTSETKHEDLDMSQCKNTLPAINYRQQYVSAFLYTQH